MPLEKKHETLLSLELVQTIPQNLVEFLLEDEKVMGTIHIALGNNVSMGGSVNVPLHLDGVVKKPTVWMDGKLLMKDGKLLVA